MIIGNWMETANNVARWCKAAKSWAEASTAERCEKEKAMADACHLKEPAEEENMTACSALASGVTARQAIASREDFNGPTRVLPSPPKHQNQRRNATAEARAETRIRITGLTAKDDQGG